IDGSPVADLGRAVDNDVGLGDSLADQVGIAQFAAIEDSPQFLQFARIARRPHDDAESLFLAHNRVGNVPADEAGGARDERTHGSVLPKGSFGEREKGRREERDILFARRCRTPNPPSRLHLTGAPLWAISLPPNWMRREAIPRSRGFSHGWDVRTKRRKSSG